MTGELKGILLCAALAAGEGLAFMTGAAASLWPLAVLLALAAALWGYGRSRRAWPFLCLFLCGMALAGRTTERRLEALEAALVASAKGPLEETFTVGDDVRTETKRGGVTFTGEVRGIPARVHLRPKPGDPAPKPGEVWRMAGTLGPPHGGTLGRRAPFWVKSGSARRLAASGSGPGSALRRARENLSRRAGLGLEDSPRAADLHRAMLLGERFRMSDEDREAFVSAGTIHIFAISGLHVLFIAALLAFALRLLYVPSRAAPFVLIPLVWVYVLLVGAGPSAVRAATMASFYHTAPVFWRRPNGFTAWALAFLVTFVRDPAMWYDVGCVLSFTVMFALILWNWWTRPFRAHRLGKYGFTAIAWLAGMPLAAHVFGRITPGGLLANLLVVPLAAVSVMMSALGLLASFVSDFLARHCNNLAALSTDLMTGFSRLLAGTGYSSYDVSPWPLELCLAFYAVLLALLLLSRPLLLRARRKI